MTGHQCSGDQFGEAADVDLGVGWHRAGLQGTDRRQAPHASINDDRHRHRRAHAHRAHASSDRPGDVVVAVDPCGPAAALHQRCEGVAVHRSSGAHRPSCQRLRIGSGGHDGNLAIRFEAPQSGGVRRHASAHLLGHRAKYLQRFNAARHQRGEPAQGGLFGGEPAILGVQLAIVAGSRRIRQQIPRRLRVRPPHPRQSSGQIETLRSVRHRSRVLPARRDR